MVMKQYLEIFCVASGQKVNFHKSQVFFSANVDEVLQQQICEVAGLCRLNEIGMYLGFPMFYGWVTKYTFILLLNKIEDHLAKWKAYVLSFVGRVSLAKSVLTILQNHLMQTLYLLRVVCDEFHKMIHQFIWGDCHGKQHVYFVHWDQMVMPLTHRGLEIGTCRETNVAFLAKLERRIK